MLNSNKGRRIARFRTLQLGGSSIKRWPLVPLAAVLALALLSLFVVPAPVTEAQTPPAHYDTDGDGLIEIANLAQLNAVRWDLDGDGNSLYPQYVAAFPVVEDGAVCPVGSTCTGYELTANLDFDENGDGEISAADSAYWNDGEGWYAIGGRKTSLSFTGTFEGNNHTIANLYVRNEGSRNGLFSIIGSEGVVRNLGMVGIDLTGVGYMGGVAGINDGTISNCYATGSANGSRTDGNYVGGLVGLSRRDATIENSWASGTVSGHYDIGGLAGESFGTVRSSYAAVDVTGNIHTGGLMGENEVEATIFDSYATGTVNGKAQVGGLVGYATDKGVITSSYATGNVRGDGDVGGLVGHNQGKITTSYASGVVNGNNRVGGLVGWNEGQSEIIASYATGNVNGSQIVGGLVGSNDYSAIATSYATGNVKTTNSGDEPILLGGLVGNNNGTITATYATGEVTGKYAAYAGSLVGRNGGERNGIVASYATGPVRGDPNSKTGGLAGFNRSFGDLVGIYFNTETTGQTSAVGSGKSPSNPLGRTTSQLQSPTGYAGIYGGWDLDVDNADGDNAPDTGGDAPWDFGSPTQYPVLKVDFDGNGTATWEEFGYQLRERPALAATPGGTEMEITWTPVDVSHWVDAPTVTYALYRDGEKMTGYGGGSRSYTDTGLTLGETYTYQVATLLNGADAQRSNLLTLQAMEMEIDYPAMAAFYRATGGDGWYDSANWLSVRPLGEWHGVTTDGDGRVTGLSLQFNNLRGELPTELANLERLEALNLHANHLSGTIPEWLGNLSNLQTLHLRFNDLTGTLPTELVNLHNLSLLDVSYNELIGRLPQSLSGLKYLGILAISDGQCAPGNDEFQEWLDGLESYSGTNCPVDREVLTALYHATGGGDWTNSDGWLSGEPLSEWRGVTTDTDGRVVGVSLINNNLVGTLPPELGKLERLQVLALDRNSISGSLPVELGDLSNLTRLALNRNQLTGAIPSELGSLPNLSIVGLARNQLSGALPASLGNLTGLTRLSLHDNTALIGSLPSGFTNLADLERLAIANTGLCAPDDEGFSAWLDTVSDKPGGVATCGSP